MPKQATNFVLAVEFDTDLDEVSTIEFVFSQMNIANSQNLKTCVWTNGNEEVGCVRDGDNDVILISWTIAETMLFERSQRFYMDTRITPKGSTDNLLTPIVELFMCPSLFYPAPSPQSAEGADG